jgi:hypothetical protein
LIVSTAMPEQGREADWNVHYTIAGAEHSKGWGAVAVHPGWSNADRFTLPADGEYTIQIEPSAGGTFALTLALSQPPDALATPESEPTSTLEPAPTSLAVDGPPAMVTLSHDLGQPRAALSFSGAAGQRLRIEVAMTHAVIGISPGAPEPCCGCEVAVMHADGTPLGDAREFTGGSIVIDIMLPTSGEYLIHLRALGNSSGQLQVSLHDAD